jgi:outer membrane protein OmpA-like peptidoglycan-associated protein
MHGRIGFGARAAALILAGLTSLAAAGDDLASSAAVEDADGCKDSPLFSRVPGSTLIACDYKEYDAIELPVAVEGDELVNKKLEGEVRNLQYQYPDSKSALQVYRNYEAAFRNAGFDTRLLEAGGSRSLVAHRTGRDEVWISMAVGNGGPYVEANIVRPRDLEQEVTADGSALLDELNRNGHLAIQGIRFTPGGADLTPDSDRMLAQLLQLLQQDAALKLRIEAHTDELASKKANVELSRRRASSIKSWLVSRGIPASRLSVDAAAGTKAVAGSAEDKATTRRIELVKR